MGKKDVVGGGIFAALGVFIWLMSFQFPELEGGHPGPSLFPRVLATLFIVFGLAVVYSGFRTRRAEEAPSPEEEVSYNFFNPILVIILIAAFIAVANRVGFIISGAAILFILMTKLRVPALRSSIVSVALVCFVYFIFSKILRVPLPIGLLGW
ncbi:MAG TPA: tripartite tricarboxylate transporter TctB family protein [Thermodesulfobacteriota bacterium]|nr:tripartite tricarboxylate transporter TctB family protein [Thermodesulfobacteriota bacterium]